MPISTATTATAPSSIGSTDRCAGTVAGGRGIAPVGVLDATQDVRGTVVVWARVGPGPLASASSNASTKAPAFGYRARGSLASWRVSTRSTATGRCGAIVRGDGGGLVRCACMNEAGLVSANGS